MDDLISRRAAIEAVESMLRRKFGIGGDLAEITLAGLPSAQPATNCSEVPNSSDVISRQAAIDALARMMPRSYTPDGSHPADEEIFRAQEVFADCIEALEILPSAEPKRGKWVDMGKDPATGKWDTRLHIYCSECGHRSDDKPTKYCPNCGAKMDGERKE